MFEVYDLKLRLCIGLLRASYSTASPKHNIRPLPTKVVDRLDPKTVTRQIQWTSTMTSSGPARRSRSRQSRSNAMVRLRGGAIKKKDENHKTDATHKTAEKNKKAAKAKKAKKDKKATKTKHAKKAKKDKKNKTMTNYKKKAETSKTAADHSKSADVDFADAWVKRARRSKNADETPCNESDAKPGDCIRVGSDCAGYGSDFLSLMLLGVNAVLVFVAEKDALKRELMKATHRGDVDFSKVIMYHDITKRDCNLAPYVDVFFTSAPCQPFSPAGRNEAWRIRSTAVLSSFTAWITCNAKGRDLWSLRTSKA